MRQVRAALDGSIKVRRELLKGGTTAHMYYLPEHAVPHLVHLLAHRPQFGEGDYKFEAVTCNFMLVALTHTAENFPFLMQLVRFIKSTEDAEAPESDVRVGRTRTRSLTRCSAETPRSVRAVAPSAAAKVRQADVGRAAGRAHLAAAGALPHPGGRRRQGPDRARTARSRLTPASL